MSVPPQMMQGLVPSTQLQSGYGPKSPAFMLALIQALMGQKAPQLQQPQQPQGMPQ